MNKTKLSNGLTIITEKGHVKSVLIEVCIGVGSNNENPKVYGVSHFLEHMVFEGTKNYKDSKAISNEIEKLGGEINAMTANERTCYYVKVPRKYFAIALNIIAEIIRYPTFDNDKLKKEIKIVGDEVNLVTDDPRHHQFVLFQKNLFEKNPARNPVYGSKASVKKLTKKKVVDYYKKYYVPNNMIITVIGDVGNILNNIKNKFGDMPRKTLPKVKKIKEPKQKSKHVKERRKTAQSYVVIGYKSAPRKHKDSYVLDVIRAILGRGQSGRLFDEIRGKRGLAYEVGVLHQATAEFGFFSVYFSTQKTNIKLVENLVYDEFRKLIYIDNKTLKDAKTFLEGEFILNEEDNLKLSDTLSFWEMTSDISEYKKYVHKIKSITKDDVKRVVRKYLTKNYVMTVIEQK